MNEITGFVLMILKWWAQRKDGQPVGKMSLMSLASGKSLWRGYEYYKDLILS